MRFSRKFPQLVSNQDMKPKGQTFWLLFNAFRLLFRWPMSNGTRSRRKRWRREMTIKKRGWAGDGREGFPKVSKVWNLWESSNVESASEVPSAWQWGREWARSESLRHGKMEDLDVTLGIQLHFQWRTTSKRKIYKMNQDESTWQQTPGMEDFKWSQCSFSSASWGLTKSEVDVKLTFFRNQENHWRSICSWKMKISLLDSLNTQTSILLYLLLKSFEYVLDLFCGSPVKELSNQLAAMGSKLLQSFEMQSVLAQLQKTVTKLQIADISFPYCEELLAWRCWKLKRLWVYKRLRWMLKQIALLPFREASCMASEEVHQRRREAGHPRLEEMTVYQVHQDFFSHLFQASLWIPFTPGHRGFSSSRASWSREGHWEDQRDRADRHRERQTKRSKRSKTEGKRWKPRSITFGGIAAGIATCSAAFGHVLGNGFGLGWAPGSIISLSKVVMTLSWTLCMQDREVIQGPNRSATSFYCQENKVDGVVHDPSTPAPFLRQPCFSTSFMCSSFTFTQFCRHTKWAEQQQASGTTNIRFFCTQSLD